MKEVVKRQLSYESIQKLTMARTIVQKGIKFLGAGKNIKTAIFNNRYNSITNPQMTSILSLAKENVIKIARVNGKMFKIDVIYDLKGTKQNKKLFNREM